MQCSGAQIGRPSRRHLPFAIVALLGVALTHLAACPNVTAIRCENDEHCIDGYECKKENDDDRVGVCRGLHTLEGAWLIAPQPDPTPTVEPDVGPSAEPEPGPGVTPETPAIASCMDEHRVLVGYGMGPAFEAYERGALGWTLQKSGTPADVPRQGLYHMALADGAIVVATSSGLQQADAETFAQIDIRGEPTYLPGASGNTHQSYYGGKLGGWWMHAGAGVVLFHPTDTSSNGTRSFLSGSFFYGATPVVQVGGTDSVLLASNEGFAVFQSGSESVSARTFDEADIPVPGGRRGIAYDEERQHVWLAGEGSLLRVGVALNGDPIQEFDFAGDVVGLNDNLALHLVIQGDELHAFYDGDVGGQWLTVSLSGTPALQASRTWTDDSFSFATPSGAALLCDRYVALATVGSLFANPDLRIVDLVDETGVTITSPSEAFARHVLVVHQDDIGLQ